MQHAINTYLGHGILLTCIFSGENNYIGHEISMAKEQRKIALCYTIGQLIQRREGME
jgi:hypothetical protein